MIEHIPTVSLSMYDNTAFTSAACTNMSASNHCKQGPPLSTAADMVHFCRQCTAGHCLRMRYSRVGLHQEHRR